MLVVFRVDASLQMGTGHVTRCLTLADALATNGIKAVFISRVLKGHLNQLIRERGYTVYSLRSPTKEYTPLFSPPHSKWLELPWEQDRDETIEILKNLKIVDWLVVDHYALDYRWELAVNSYVNRIMVIDDLKDRLHDCHLLLDQTFGRKKSDYAPLASHDCHFLLGTRYVLLRPEFETERNFLIKNPKKIKAIKSIFVSMGGTDTENITSLILEGLNNSKLGDKVEIKVVIGRNTPHLEKLKELASNSRLPTSILVDVKNMAHLMASADLAIGAGGGTSWERCCVGLPTLLIVAAENQRGIANKLAELGAVKLIGDKYNINNHIITLEVNAIINNFELLQTMRKAGMAVCDGSGVKLLPEILQKFQKPMPIYIMQSTMLDCDLVYQWQLDPKTRQYSRNPNPPSYTEHCTWFSNTLNNKNRRMWMIYYGHHPVGILRIDDLKEKSAYEISIFIAPLFYRRTIAVSAIKLAQAKFGKLPIYAEIHKKNEASHKLFMRCNFHNIQGNWFVWENNMVKKMKTIA